MTDASHVPPSAFTDGSNTYPVSSCDERCKCKIPRSARVLGSPLSQVESLRRHQVSTGRLSDFEWYKLNCRMHEGRLAFCTFGAGATKPTARLASAGAEISRISQQARPAAAASRRTGCTHAYVTYKAASQSRSMRSCAAKRANRKLVIWPKLPLAINAHRVLVAR